MIIRNTFSGEHPTKKAPAWRGYGMQNCHAEVVAVIGLDKIAVSMNGTAVMTVQQFREWSQAILKVLDD